MFKKVLFIIFLFFASTIEMQGFSEDQLTKIEYLKYGICYPNESLGERLNRLENDYFGMGQNGDINSRINMLERIASNSGRNSLLTPNETFYPGERKSAIRNFWNNVTSTFDRGTITGFTPSMTSSGYNYSNDIYNNDYLNFPHNSSKYCPYHNRYHNNFLNIPDNRFSWNNRHNTGFIDSGNGPFGSRICNNCTNSPHNNHHIRHNRFNNYRNMNNPYTPAFNPRYDRTYIPSNLNTNITTRSSVHILKD